MIMGFVYILVVIVVCCVCLTIMMSYYGSCWLLSIGRSYNLYLQQNPLLRSSFHFISFQPVSHNLVYNHPYKIVLISLIHSGLVYVVYCLIILVYSSVCCVTCIRLCIIYGFVIRPVSYITVVITLVAWSGYQYILFVVLLSSGFYGSWYI